MDSETFTFSITMIVAGIAAIASLVSALIVTYQRKQTQAKISESQRLKSVLEKIEEIQKDVKLLLNEKQNPPRTMNQ
ncbi:MAG: hypothetical protein VSS75_028740 [Candidatus Parabeggiatoa sp.]|nr:hypothetical protein [Candidatus Parabeggiatoa sp.]